MRSDIIVATTTLRRYQHQRGHVISTTAHWNRMLLPSGMKVLVLVSVPALLAVLALLLLLAVLLLLAQIDHQSSVSLSVARLLQDQLLVLVLVLGV